MSTARTPKPPARFALPGTPDQPVPGLVRAASLALAVARHCKAGSWAEFSERLAARDETTLTLLAGLDVDPADSALVTEHDHVLRLLNVRPLVTVAVCPVCDAWVLTTGAAPTKCRVTARCTGKPVKASIANKEKVVVGISDLPEDPEDPDVGSTDGPNQVHIEGNHGDVRVAVTVSTGEPAA